MQRCRSIGHPQRRSHGIDRLLAALCQPLVQSDPRDVLADQHRCARLLSDHRQDARKVLMGDTDSTLESRCLFRLELEQHDRLARLLIAPKVHGRDQLPASGSSIR